MRLAPRVSVSLHLLLNALKKTKFSSSKDKRGLLQFFKIIFRKHHSGLNFMAAHPLAAIVALASASIPHRLAQEIRAKKE